MALRRLGSAYPGGILTGDQIRLITLHPGDWNDPIRCSIGYNSLAALKGKYYTLSYVWGSPHKKRNIWLQGLEWPVTLNLEGALRHLRLVYGEITIWIDALCIDVSPSFNVVLIIAGSVILTSCIAKLAAGTIGSGSAHGSNIRVLSRSDHLPGE